jgi:tRNA A-37 threonylcarbamoyl transferase component Bud32
MAANSGPIYPPIQRISNYEIKILPVEAQNASNISKKPDSTVNNVNTIININSTKNSPKSPDPIESISFNNNNGPISREGPSNYNLSNGVTLGMVIKIINTDSTKNSISQLELGHTIEITEPIHFFIKRLGDGSFGEAFLVWVDDSKKYVLKRLRKKYAALNNKNTFINTGRNISLRDKLRELDMLMRVKGNLSIVQLEAAQLDESKNDVYFLFKYIPGMTFLEYFNTDYRYNVRNPGKIERKKQILNGILDAIQELHKLGITHADIKPENIYIPDEGTGRQPFLLDLGSANLTAPFPHIYSRSKNYKKLAEMINKMDGIKIGLNSDLIRNLSTITHINKNEYITEKFGGSTRKRRKIKKKYHIQSKRKSIR